MRPTGSSGPDDSKNGHSDPEIALTRRFPHRPLQLPAGRINIPPPGPPDIRWNPLLHQVFLKRRHIPSLRHPVRRPRPRIPNNQVHLQRQIRPPQQLHHFFRVLLPVIYAPQQHVLKGHPLLRPQRHFPHSIQNRRNIPLAIDGHHLGPNRIIRSIQADRQFRPHRLLRESQYPRHNPRSRNRHPRRRNPNFLHQQPHRIHKCVVVQERLAHSHKDQVDPVPPNLHLLPLQHRNHLPGNLACRQVPHDSQLRRQAELAVHRAPNLARNANRRPLRRIFL